MQTFVETVFGVVFVYMFGVVFVYMFGVVFVYMFGVGRALNDKSLSPNLCGNNVQLKRGSTVIL